MTSTLPLRATALSSAVAYLVLVRWSGEPIKNLPYPTTPTQMKSDSISTSVHQKFSRFSIARKLIGQSGFLSPRLLVALLCCLGASLIAARTLPVFFQGEEPAKFSRRTLSFAERVAYQRAIEDVYWRHRIWPDTNPGPKPSLDAVMSQAQIEKKVARLSAQLTGAGGLLATADHC